MTEEQVVDIYRRVRRTGGSRYELDFVKEFSEKWDQVRNRYNKVKTKDKIKYLREKEGR